MINLDMLANPNLANTKYYEREDFINIEGSCFIPGMSIDDIKRYAKRLDIDEEDKQKFFDLFDEKDCLFLDENNCVDFYELENSIDTSNSEGTVQIIMPDFEDCGDEWYDFTAFPGDLALYIIEEIPFDLEIPVKHGDTLKNGKKFYFFGGEDFEMLALEYVVLKNNL